MLLWNTLIIEFRKSRLKRLGRWRLSCCVSRLSLVLLFLGMGGMQSLLASGVEEGNDLRLVASTSFIGELCEALAGDDAHIKVLMPRRLNPHSYQPGPGDFAAIEIADRVFIHGLGLEHQLSDAFEDLDYGVLVSIMSDVDMLSADDDEHGGFNPHLWLSPRNMMAGIRAMRASLSDVNPEKTNVYIAREKEYLQRLSLLNARVREATMSLDQGSRRLVTGHPFMDYYARDYGFEIVGHIVDSFSDQAEPSAREIAELVNLLKEEEISAIFISDSADRAMKLLAEAVVAESGREIRIVELLAESLAPIGERGSNYFDFIMYNTELIVEALNGE